MRIYLQTSHNTFPVPYNHLYFFRKCIHKWLGDNNEYHDPISLYTFSFLKKANSSNHLDFPNGSSFFFSSYDSKMIKKIIEGIKKDPNFIYGMKIIDWSVKDIPQILPEIFNLGSPIFVKRTFHEGDKNDGSYKKKEKYYLYGDEEIGLLMTETLKTKMKSVGLSDDNLSISFDKSYNSPKINKYEIKPATKLHKAGEIKTSNCPIIIKGKSSSRAFAWCVGIGDSTGMGLGSLE